MTPRLAEPEHETVHVETAGQPVQGAAGVWPEAREDVGSSLRAWAPRLVAGALLATYLAFYGPVFATALRDCWNDPNYSHGVLVPIAALALAWMRRRDVFYHPGPVRRAWNIVAWSALGFGCAGWVAAGAAAEEFTQRAAGIGIGLGLSGVLGGAARLRRYGWPILLLLCAVPLPSLVYSQVSFPLQLLSARLAAGTLDLLGLEVVRSGNIFEVNGNALEVVRACSGIRSIMALGTLAFAAAVALRLRPWQVLGLAAAVLPAALCGNLLRLVATSLLVVGFGPSTAEGHVHEAVGVASFVASLAILAVVLRLVRHGDVARSDAAPAGAPHAEGDAAAATRWRSPLGALPLSRLRFEVVAAVRAFAASRPPSTRAAAGALALLVTAGGYAMFLHRHAVEAGAPVDLAAVPLDFDVFRGTEIPMTDRVLDQVQADDYVFRSYAAPAGPDVALYVGYYRNPRQGAQIHSPRHCYPGAGWKIRGSEPLVVRDLAGALTPMRRLVVDKNGRRDVVVYWYETRTGRLTGDLELKLALMRTALLHRPQDAAFVRWSTALDGGESVEDATRRLLSAVARAHAHLEAALPFSS